MKWLKNLEAFAASGKPGACPFCGSPDTDYSYTAVEKKGNMGYCDLWCSSCRKGFHISRIRVPDHAKTGGAPADIRYFNSTD